MDVLGIQIINLGDILAIPFFLLLIVYFANKPKKTPIEYILLIFSVCGFFADIIFTMNYLYG